MADTPINLFHPGTVPIGRTANGAPVYLDQKWFQGFFQAILRRVGGESNFYVSDITAIAASDGTILVGDGSTFVGESGATARASLGLTIGTHVQAFDDGLQDIADLADPNADRILFWDDSAGAHKYLTLGTNLSIADTTLNASGGGGSAYTDMDDAPATPHASDFEGTSVTGWTFLVSTGSATQQSAIIDDSFESTTGPSSTNPLYNVDDDLNSQLVMQPTLQGKFAMYRGFTPASGDKWCMAAKARLLPTANASISDDRIMFGVTSDSTPSFGTNEITNSIAAEFRTSGVNFTCASIAPATRTNESGARDGVVYLGIVGRSDNSICVYTSSDGLWWRIHRRITSGTTPAGAGTVKNAFIYIQDINNDGQAPIMIVDWIRFSGSHCNLTALGGGR